MPDGTTTVNLGRFLEWTVSLVQRSPTLNGLAPFE
jgi:hypothetical protein